MATKVYYLSSASSHSIPLEYKLHESRELRLSCLLMYPTPRAVFGKFLLNE